MKRLITALIPLLLISNLACAADQKTHDGHTIVPQKKLNKPYSANEYLGLGFKTIKEVNDFVNLYPYYNTREWTVPKKFLRVKKGGGDCAGYTIAKRELILQNKLAEDKDMRFLLLQIRKTGEYHAVLDVKGMSLDNRYEGMQSITGQRFKEEYKILGVEVPKEGK